MRIGICTVYQSYNCGSFLQAYALQKILSKKGTDVCFLHNKLILRDRLPFRLLQCLKFAWGEKKRLIRNLLDSYYNFKDARKHLNIKRHANDLDLIVLGSDTIWNISDPYFLKMWTVFWGKSFNTRKITYAASVGGTKPSCFEDKIYLTDCLNDLDKIAVRDSATMSLVEKHVGFKKPVRVVDPTMLLSIDEYKEIAHDCSDKDYILFYYFGEIHPKIKRAIKKYATDNRKKIIAFGADYGWADKYISLDPFDMLGYFANADLIITNTFHGSVFSILFNKRFWAFAKEKNKVVDLLKEYGLEERLVSADDGFAPALADDLCFESANKILAKNKAESLEYLYNAISDNGVKE